MTTPARLRSIVIVGGGSAGWIAAAALARLTPMGIGITVIDSAVEEPPVQTVLPAHKVFHALIGIDEHEMLAAAHGTMRLGTTFDDQRVQGPNYHHAFGDFGLEIGGVEFYQVWLRARAAGRAIDLDNYNLAAIAATMGRFARPTADKRAMMDYGYHLDTRRYTALLKIGATGKNVACLVGDPAGAEIDRGNGAIAAIILRDGRRVEGDLFVDCSGASSVLAEQVPGTGFDDWNTLFPRDRAVSVDGAALADLPPRTRASWRARGWWQQIPLQHCTHYGLAFASGMTEPQVALAEVTASAGTPCGDPHFITRRMGRRRRFWVRNLVALGSAAARIESIETSELDWARIGITALLSLIPDRGAATAEADQFERLMSAELEECRDLALLHEVTMEGEPVLRIGGEKIALPDSLAHRIALFGGRGRLLPDAGPWRRSDWLAVMLGRGIVPTSWDPLADDIEPVRAQQNFLRLAGLFRQSAETMPRHADYIAHHCPAVTRRP
ncbi:tryptophan 7-halogenase [Sphingomonas oligophenolica]|uniref:Tryptophan halogenase family protein n=1 Tax=Sphingomonas oligophenolica TaxID=301154 RepID=A0ABU9Y4E9_9SPHN